MPGYTTRQQQVRLGRHNYNIRWLRDDQQFADPDGRAERFGISSAPWCLFGQVWPAGRLLANAMGDVDILGKRIVEIGCGLGLASPVLRRRGADIIASDMHPLAEPFLAYNSALNALPSVAYRKLRWGVPLPTLGLFDLVTGSDVLYERNHAEMLADLIERHTHAASEILITDPGRGNSAPFSRALALQGFEVSEERGPMDDHDIPPFRGRLLHYRHSTAGHSAAAGLRQ